MRVIGIPRSVLFFGILRNFVASASWTDKLSKYIAEESGARQVSLISSLGENEYFDSRIIDEVFSKVGEKIPIVRINVRPDGRRQLPFETDWEGSTSAPSTFFLFVHESRGTPTVLPSNESVDLLAEMSTFQYGPKYMILFVTRASNDSLEGLLQHAWTKNMLDFTIIEYVETETFQGLRRKTQAPAVPIVHRLNPFKKRYTRVNLTFKSGNLFPDKLDDMWGYPLRIKAVNSVPFSVSKFNELNEPEFVGGPSILLIQYIAKKFNASLKYLPVLSEQTFKDSQTTSFNDLIYQTGKSRKIDINSYLVTRSADSRYSSLVTTPIIVDEFCAVVPILFESKTTISARSFLAYGLSIGIVVIFFIVKRVLHLPPAVWQIFNIARVLFGVSVTQLPSANVERILFASLLAVSSMYSSEIYTAITEISLRSTTRVKFESFDDLDRSGLIPQINPFSINKTFDQSRKNLRNLMKKSNASFEDAFKCGERAVRDKTIACFMYKTTADFVIEMTKRNGRAELTIARPCFWGDSRGFQLSGRSPYRARIDQIIARLHDTGIIEKLYDSGKTYSRKEKEKDDEDANAFDLRENMAILRKHLLSILIIGYSMSFAVLGIEILVHRLSQRKKSKVRPVVLFPYTE